MKSLLLSLGMVVLAAGCCVAAGALILGAFKLVELAYWLLAAAVRGGGGR